MFRVMTAIISLLTHRKMQNVMVRNRCVASWCDLLKGCGGAGDAVGHVPGVPTIPAGDAAEVPHACCYRRICLRCLKHRWSHMCRGRIALCCGPLPGRPTQQRTAEQAGARAQMPHCQRLLDTQS